MGPCPDFDSPYWIKPVERDDELMAGGIITLITDFGTRDYYVGAMKGVILGIDPEVRLIDITHDISPGNIRHGSHLIAQVRPCFPPETIYLAVVDPGVGGNRRPIAVETEEGIFVGPDNGLFTSILEGRGVERVVEITEKRAMLPPVSSTFHGRDVFAPAAAHLSLGDLHACDLGPEINDPITLETSRPMVEDDRIRGVVIDCDRFGNIISSIPEEIFRRFSGNDAVAVEIRGTTIEQIGETYVSVGKGELVALIGSTGLLEVSVNGGSAEDRLGAREGDEILIRRKGM